MEIMGRRSLDSCATFKSWILQTGTLRIVSSLFRSRKTSRRNTDLYISGIEVSGNTQPADYCVNSGAACKNKCAAAYGPAFILVNEIWNKDLNAGGGGITDQRWDRW